MVDDVAENGDNIAEKEADLIKKAYLNNDFEYLRVHYGPKYNATLFGLITEDVAAIEGGRADLKERVDMALEVMIASQQDWVNYLVDTVPGLKESQELLAKLQEYRNKILESLNAGKPEYRHGSLSVQQRKALEGYEESGQ